MRIWIAPSGAFGVVSSWFRRDFAVYRGGSGVDYRWSRANGAPVGRRVADAIDRTLLERARSTK